MTTATYTNEHLEQEKSGIIQTIKDVWRIQSRYEGIFTAAQCCVALKISPQRFNEIRDRLETITLKEFGSKVYYTGRGLIAYRETLKTGRPEKEK